MTIAAAATTAIVPTGEAKLHAAAPEDRDGGPCGQHRWQCPGCENNFQLFVKLFVTVAGEGKWLSRSYKEQL